MKYYLYNSQRYFTGSQEFPDGLKPANGTTVAPSNEPNQKWMGNEWKNIPLPQKSLKTLQDEKIVKIQEAFEAERKALLNVPEEERSTWEAQRKEYEAYQLDNTSATPIIDKLVEGDNSVGGVITKEELLTKIGSNITALEEGIAYITGKQHGLERQVKNSTSASDVYVIKY